MVGRAKEPRFLIGSCSDRFPSAPRALWEAREIDVDFATAKHVLGDVKERCEPEIYLHTGDRGLDQQIAERARFEF